MLSRIRRLPRPATVIASLALVLAVGGGTAALALTHSEKKQVKKIAKKVANKQITKRAPHLSVSHANTADNSSALGGAGASSYERAIQWALVAGDGSIISQSGGITVTPSGTGNYGVNFGHTVAGHAISLTLSDLQGSGAVIRGVPCGGAAAGPGATDCVAAFNNANTLGVRVFDNAGGSISRPFYVVLFN